MGSIPEACVIRSVKTISTDCALFSFRLFARVHGATWSSSASLDWALLAGMTIYATASECE